MRNEPENYCRPAADPMLGSLVPLYGSRLLAIVPTGIGSDGCKGSQAAAAAGVCSAVLPLSDIAPYVRKLAAMSAA